MTSCTIQSMKTVAAARFKEQCLGILDSLQPDGIVITKRGRPVARLIPIRADRASMIGSLRAKIRLRGDTRSTGVRWNASAQP